VASGVLVAWIVSENAKEKRHERTIERFVGDPQFRKEMIDSGEFLRCQKGSLAYSTRVIHSFTEDEIRRIWNRRNDQKYRGCMNLVLLSRNAPPDVLRECYQELVAEAKKRGDGKVPEALKSQDMLLRNPNLPEDVIEEIQSFKDPELDDILDHNPSVWAKKMGEAKK
jgi:hypothetical protein